MKTTFSTKADTSGLIVIPLCQGKSELSESVVKLGDEVLAGQLIGKAKNIDSLNIYSSVAGHVVAIDKMSNTSNALIQSVLLQMDKDQKFAPKIEMGEITKDNLVKCIEKIGLLSYDKTTLASNLQSLNTSDIKSLAVMVFDEYSDLDLQEYILLNNASTLTESLGYVAKLLGVSCINFYLPTKKVNSINIINEILKNNKNDLNINFVEIKLPKSKNAFIYFKNYVLKNNMLSCFAQTPETFIDLYKGLKEGTPKLSRLVYIGGSATKLNNGYLMVTNGSSLDIVKRQCEGLVFEEQEIEDLKADCVDFLDEMYEALDLYKKENDKEKRKALKLEYKKKKKKANAEIWKFVKNQRANLGKTIRQIRIGSVSQGQIFTDFSPILDMSDNAVYFLNRTECRS